jgi:hypothetical protein
LDPDLAPLDVLKTLYQKKLCSLLLNFLISSFVEGADLRNRVIFGKKNAGQILS